MKKLIVILGLMSALFVPAAQAVTPPLFAAFIGAMVGANWGKPVPAYLTDACQPVKVKAENGNYFFESIEHCKRDMK